jgi:hypothetical protein
MSGVGGSSGLNELMQRVDEGSGLESFNGEALCG